MRAHQLAARVPAAGWEQLSCGQGSKGPRYYDCALIATASTQYHLLERRSLTPGGKGKPELAFFTCHAPAGTALAQLVTVAGNRWAVEECFQAAKNETGLDHYQVRRYDACTGTPPCRCSPWHSFRSPQLKRGTSACGQLTLAQAPPGTRPEIPLPATPAATPQAAALALDAGTLTGMADAEWNVERHLLGKPPEVVALYHHFTRLVSACGPFTYSVSKSAITFKGARRGFAGARLGHRALGGYLDLQRRVDDHRITRSSPYTSRLYVHQFRIETASQLDDEFAGWIREAYQVGGGAHLSGIGTPAMRP
jgi:hypothetical protein